MVQKLKTSEKAEQPALFLEKLKVHDVDNEMKIENILSYDMLMKLVIFIFYYQTIQA